MSLFAVISAVATDATAHGDEDFPDEPDDGGADEIELSLAPPPPSARRRAGQAARR